VLLAAKAPLASPSFTGNVGIGTSSPVAALDVTGTDAVGTLTSLADTVTRASTIIRGSNHSNGYGLYMGYGNSATDAQYIQSTLKTGSAAFPLLINPYGGNVGINTASPRALLDLGAGSGDGSLSNTPSQYQVVLAAPTGTGDYGRNIGWVEANSNIVAAINAVDNGTSSSTGLTFSTGNTSAIAEAMRINSVGIVTKPLQPAFRLTKVGDQTIPATIETTVSFQTEVFDVNSDCTSGVFTAPVDGIYVFKFVVRFDSPDRSATYHDVRILTSGQAFKTLKDFGGYNSSSYEIMDNTIITQMDAGDTATPAVYIANGAGTQNLSDDSSRTHFSGYLLG
jgi:hypothetical protein